MKLHYTLIFVGYFLCLFFTVHQLFLISYRLTGSHACKHLCSVGVGSSMQTAGKTPEINKSFDFTQTACGREKNSHQLSVMYLLSAFQAHQFSIQIIFRHFSGVVKIDEFAVFLFLCLRKFQKYGTSVLWQIPSNGLSPLLLGCMALAAKNVDWRLWNKSGPRQCVSSSNHVLFLEKKYFWSTLLCITTSPRSADTNKDDLE